MNALQILQAVSYEGNLSILGPSSSGVASATDPPTLQLINMLYAAGRRLLQSKTWIQLKRTYTINTVPGTLSYDLPTDFYCSLLDTFWDTTNRWKMGGPLSDSQFDQLLYGYALVANRKYYRVFGFQGTHQIQITPDPGTAVLTFDYMANTWINHSGTWQATITADTDTFAFDDDLMILGTKAFLYKEKGWEWQPFMDDFEGRIAAAEARWNGSKKISLFPENYLLWYPNIPEGSFAF